MTDLEQDLRDALHARGDAVTAADLRHAGAPRDRRPRTRYYAPLAAAAAVVIIGGGAAAIVAHSSTGTPHTAGGSRVTTFGADLAGTRWQLASVTTSTTTIRIPASLGAEIDFGRGDRLTGNDSVNGYSGRYRRTGDAVVISGLASTLVGYAGPSRTIKAAMAGFAVLRGSVPTHVTGGTLTMRADDTTLTFTQIGDLDPGFTGVSAPPSGSGTPSSTGAPPSSTQSYVNGSELPASSGPS